MTAYKVLINQKFSIDRFSIVPIRYEDRMNILKWRNEQIYHLRQQEPLTEKDQERYFNTIINKLYDQKQPSQILFSYMKDDICIGYGGLVHINWADRNAEISFIMDTALEKENFSKHWSLFLGLIEKVAFKELKFYKIFTFAFDVRPHLYDPIENVGFVKEATLKKHCLFNGKLKDIIIHAKFNVTDIL